MKQHSSQALRMVPMAPIVLGVLALSTACSSTPDSFRGYRQNPGGDSDAGAKPSHEVDANFGNSMVDLRDPSDAGDRVPDICADVEATAERVIPTVTFLIDGSGSMACAYPEPDDCDCESQLRKLCTAPPSQSRWDALSESLLAPGAGVIAQLQSVVRFGVLVYNNHPDDSSCPAYPAEVPAALDNAAAIAAAYPATAPGANTPTGLAFQKLAGELPDAAQRAAQGLGPQVIVLATDGQPFQCYDPAILETPPLDYQTVLDATAQAANKSIGTYVLSLAPTSGDYAVHLNDVAQLGGTGMAFAPASSLALQARLDAIITDNISCEITLQGSVEDGQECAGTVELGGDPLACDDPDGYRVVDPSHVELQGAACERFRNDPQAALRVVFPCKTFIPG